MDKLQALKRDCEREFKWATDDLEKYVQEESSLKHEVLLVLNKKMQCYCQGRVDVCSSFLKSINSFLPEEVSHG